MDNILLFIGLMKRARALAIGADQAADCAERGHAKIFLLASDATDNTRRAVANAARERQKPVFTLQYTKLELGAALGQRECAAFAIADAGFAAAIAEKLGLDVKIRAPRPKIKKKPQTPNAVAAVRRRGDAKPKRQAAPRPNSRSKGLNKGDRV